MNGVKIFINGKPTRRDLDDFLDDYNAELRKGYERVGRKVMGIAKAKAPRRSGAMKSSMKLTTYKAAGFKVWWPKGAKSARKGVKVYEYAGAIHWGGRGGSRKSNDNDGRSGTKFLYNVVYPNVRPGVRPKKAGPVREWIVRDVERAIQSAVDKVNAKGANVTRFNPRFVGEAGSTSWD